MSNKAFLRNFFSLVSRFLVRSPRSVSQPLLHQLLFNVLRMVAGMPPLLSLMARRRSL
ncbi:hypothetical protein QUA54_27590 [Microcoleus sp. MOSTC5]|uniref:hypothetical protein n=1 Tax=Microcoleus sp. MOSTC5 TaxID=3055378 RepID=UPI002FD2B045